MARAKHGKHDAEKGPPDNTGQPVGSGLIVWFHEQIRRALGDEAGNVLIETAKKQGSRRDKWLCEQLRDYDQAALADEYEDRRRADVVQRRLHDKERVIAQCEARLKEEVDASQARIAYLRRQIKAAQRYIEERTEEPAQGERSDV